MCVCHKVKHDGQVFDPAATNPQGSRLDFTWKEVVTGAYHDVPIGVQCPRVSDAKSNLMGQCLTQPKLTPKEVGRILPGWNCQSGLL